MKQNLRKMAKPRTMNELRQEKEYQIKKVHENRTHPCSESTAKAIAEHQLKHKNPFEHAEVDKTVDQIVEDLQPQIFDYIFQQICEEMEKRYVFDS